MRNPYPGRVCGRGFALDQTAVRRHHRPPARIGRRPWRRNRSGHGRPTPGSSRSTPGGCSRASSVISASSTSARTRSGSSSTTTSAGRRFRASTRSPSSPSAPGSTRAGRLSDEAIAHAVDAIGRFAAIARAMRVEKVHMIATEATRRATNRGRLRRRRPPRGGPRGARPDRGRGGDLRRARGDLRLLPAEGADRRHGRRQPRGGRSAGPYPWRPPTWAW